MSGFRLVMYHIPIKSMNPKAAREPKTMATMEGVSIASSGTAVGVMPLGGAMVGAMGGSRVSEMSNMCIRFGTGEKALYNSSTYGCELDRNGHKNRMEAFCVLVIGLFGPVEVNLIC